MIKISTLLLATLLFIGCSNNSDKSTQLVETTSNDFVRSIESAHQMDIYNNYAAYSFDIELYFGGNESLKASITSLGNSGKIKLVKNTGEIVYFDGKDVFLSTSSENYPSARFDIHTWQYFFGVPYKLSDPGVKWDDMGKMPYNSVSYPVQKLSFNAGIGDAPDDWYMVYSNPENNLLNAMAYIVTYSRPQEEAEKRPSSIVYQDFKEVQGIPVAQTWRFCVWDEGTGPQFDKEKGYAVIKNVVFHENAEGMFDMPEGLTKIEK